MGTWDRFWRLSRFERGVVLTAAAGLAATWLGLRLVGFRRWKAALARLSSSPDPALIACSTEHVQIDTAKSIARMEQSTARHLFFRTNCLEQSLTLWWLLQRRGIAADLRIGARKDADTFEAHAWVECGGLVLSEIGETHLQFVPFDGPVASMETQTP